ncbi:hypothetical protein [Aggregatilinea lenta]|uniref:hypothetical protein n=1 Tax=Aggregatilinea lenta TaxID=913108 RepID=UPI0013C37916|nr:hypothetical protein [Aggregatilinea lenta]
MARIDDVMLSLQQQWGPQALYQARADSKPLSAWSTGDAALDALTGINGIPRGKLTEFVGRPTCGMTTVALRLAGHSQAQCATPIYFDLSETLDPYYASRCGIHLDQLLVVRARPEQALDILLDLVKQGNAPLIIVDHAESLINARSGQFASVLRQLKQAAYTSSSAVIFLSHITPDSGNLSADILSPYIVLRLLFVHRGWLWDEGDVKGCETRIVVQKSPSKPTGHHISLPVTFVNAI